MISMNERDAWREDNCRRYCRWEMKKKKLKFPVLVVCALFCYDDKIQ